MWRFDCRTPGCCGSVLWVAQRFRSSGEAAYWAVIHQRLVHRDPWAGAER